MDLTDDQIQQINAWARERREITAVRLYGSRARGTSHEHSDVDLAISLEGDESETLSIVIQQFEKWAGVLSERLGLRAHIEPDFPGTSVRAWAEKQSLPIYNRESAAPMVKIGP